MFVVASLQACFWLSNRFRLKFIFASQQEFKSKMQALDIRKENLHKKKQEMADYIIKYDQFLKENDQKKQRARMKAEKERELKKQREIDLINMHAETASLKEEKKMLDLNVRKNAVYARYLEKVLEVSSEFQEIRQLLGRYDTLISTNKDLLQTAQENQEVIEKAGAQLAHCIEQKTDEILQYNNKLSDLQTLLDRAHSKALLWESRWAHIQNTAAKKTLLLGTIKMATLNLFQTIVKEMKDEAVAVPLEDTATQLDMIQQHIQRLTEIWQEVTKTDDSTSGTNQTYQNPKKVTH
ncbi:coiled-coil domain-containing protein 42-like [Protopterus annectens]|uniref:coiled-coil domain-containing protein 42-like n=1 Tax=Protopterus annectens TaxID=7888 RepID=UPI001CFAAC4B|nr:coiled-coil domain-containing protein 42-like [Protopterus annectens]